MATPRRGLSTYELVLFALLAALTFGLQVAMAQLPNIEPVSLLLMVFTRVFGLKALLIAYVFVLLEVLLYGISLWTINYLYIWAILCLAVYALRRVNQPLLWAAISGMYGLLFGALCAIPYLFIGGPGLATSYFVSGIPFDLLHCAGNFVLALLLGEPLVRLTRRAAGRGPHAV